MVSLKRNNNGEFQEVKGIRTRQSSMSEKVKDV